MIDEKIKRFGGNFRGLWNIRELTSKAKRRLGFKEFITKWYVTFKYNGDFLETESQDTIEEALDYAINFLGLSKKK